MVIEKYKNIMSAEAEMLRGSGINRAGRCVRFWRNGNWEGNEGEFELTRWFA